MSGALPSPAAPASSELADAAARRAIREQLEQTLIVEAAAGTGKTSELVARIGAVLRAGLTTLERIVAVTFTEKAAGELKLRLRAQIERLRTGCAPGSAERQRLDRALAELELARIGTIHGFCAELLRERPLEAGVDPLFEVLAQDEQDRLLERVFGRWFEAALADPPEGVRRVLRRRSRGAGSAGPRRELRSAAAALLEQRDFRRPWRREPFARAERIQAVLERLREAAALATRAARADDYLAQNLAELARFLDELEHREAVRERDLDGLEAELRELLHSRHVHWHWRGSPRQPYAPDIERASALELRDGARAALAQCVRECDADLAPLLQRELSEVVLLYERAKQRAGRLDFLDLVLRARDLVRNQPRTAAELRARFTHFFVDEFQDTDPLQAELLLRLAAAEPAPADADWRLLAPSPGKLFLVGDPQQSIYRFRRADVELYESIARELCARGAQRVQLHTSFRAVPELQSAVNAAFAGLMRGEPAGAQARYTPLAPARAAPPAEQPALVALPVPRPYGDYGQLARWRIEQSLPDAVGAFVDWLTSRSGWSVEEPGAGGRRVPIAPRHVCLLLRRLRRLHEDVTRPYARALEVRRIPHVLLGGRSFHDREEVLALRNALVAIEWPEDELRVFAVLRGPFFSLGDDALLAWRGRHGRLHPLARPELGGERAEAEVAEALALLRELHLRRNQRAIATTIAELLERVRAHAGIAIWPTGEQALANCLRLLDLARRFERSGTPSLRAFAERLESDAAAGETEEAAAVEEGTEGVRIMTVHRAKGLEFPVVILLDPCCRAVREQPGRHLDAERGLCAQLLCGCAPRELLEQQPRELARERAEAVRLAYVAATRARDLLVVPAIGDAWSAEGTPLGLSGTALQPGAAPGSPEALGPDAGWLDALRPVLTPPRDRRRSALPPALPGGPDFSPEADSVLERPERAQHSAQDSVAPGLHRPELGEHRVLWWDPRALELDRSWSVGLRQQRILEADAGEVRSERGAQAQRTWWEQRERRLAAGARPGLRARTATALAGELAVHAAPAGSPAVELHSAVAGGARPGGRRFGALVHAVLAAVPLGADAQRTERCARAQGRLLGAEPAEIEAAAQAALDALAHPVLRRAAASPDVRRESPLLWRRPDGTLLEGVADLAFRELTASGPRWTVVDFKTDRELSTERARYERQLQLYAEGIAAATGEPAQAILLRV